MTSNVNFVTVTPDMARKMLSEYQYIGQRKYRPDRAKYLADEIARDSLEEITQVVLSSQINDGRKYLINGQHTLNAIVMANKPARVVLVETEKNDDTATAKVYGVIDTNLTRSTADALAALHLASELGFTPSQLNQIGAAVRMIRLNFKQTDKSRMHLDDMVRLIREYSESADSYYETIVGCSKEIQYASRRQSTLAVALLTFQYSAKKYTFHTVREFWKGAIFDDAIAEYDPRKDTYKFLLTTGVQGGMWGSKYQKLRSARYMAHYIAGCFNDYIEGKNNKSRRVLDESKPVVLLGTPFDGTRG